MVTEDVVLDNWYLLKIGYFLVMPNETIHLDDNYCVGRGRE